MNTQELETLMKNVLTEMEVKGYKLQTINSEKFVFKQLLRYCNKNEIEFYNLEIGLKFLEEHYHLSHQ